MAVSEADERAMERQRSFVSEVFHNLSQPLTALHCSLELSLFRDQTADELRAGIATALENAACLRQRLLLLRELNQASEPGDLSLPTDLNELLRDLREELLPLFESAGQQFDLHLEAGQLQVGGNQYQADASPLLLSGISLSLFCPRSKARARVSCGGAAAGGD